jgi:hypothetical protein
LEEEVLGPGFDWRGCCPAGVYALVEWVFEEKDEDVNEQDENVEESRLMIIKSCVSSLPSLSNNH